MAGVPDVASALGTPLAFNPNSAAMGRAAVATGNPDVAVTVPTVIAGDPDPVAVNGWGRGDDFYGARRRRANADHDLRVGHADGEEECAGCGEDLLLHRFCFSMNCT